ncbi:MAG: [protein-PII] uridylyltransferase [Terriglobales bacterium]
MTFVASGASLSDFYAAASAASRRQFELDRDGPAMVRARAETVDTVVRGLFCELLNADHAGFCLVALGGYGRATLFPFSDVDLLFLAENGRIEERHRQAVAQLCRTLWDLRIRVSPAHRTLSACNEVQRDNLEFAIALLDSRYLAGDAQLYSRLHDSLLPQLISREHDTLRQNLSELTQQRHAKYGRTIFHLEPNVKDGPGGLRDYQVACWLELIAQVKKRRQWPSRKAAECDEAFNFLCTTRCFLHYRQGRNDNQLSYEAQADAAAAQIAAPAASAAEWMRHYFRHARVIDRAVGCAMDEVAAARSSLYRGYGEWRSRLSNADFLVSAGRVFLRESNAARDPETVLRLFEFAARHGLPLSVEAERAVENAVADVRAWRESGADIWPRLKSILSLPNAGLALRAMHRTGVLFALLPELQPIDALVVRDFYHRYTVDEHSFTAIDTVHALRCAEGMWARKYAEILAELEQPELLTLALLFHDVGKAEETDDHIAGSLQALEAALPRLQLADAEADTVRFLIASHLELSAAMRRDIFDPLTIRAVALKVGDPECLKLLCLMTYADISAVNPEALTPWKAEMLWHLYASTANHLTRRLDEERIDTEPLSGMSDINESELRSFAAGLPRRYLLTHTAQEIAEHVRMAQELARPKPPPAVLRLRRLSSAYELTLLTRDRPRLFVAISGTLAAWGMNIVKATAFANRAGLVLDCFRFTDRFRSFELNPGEMRRFENDLLDVISGERNLQELLQRRSHRRPTVPKIKIESHVWADQLCSAQSTVVEVTTADRPGLLHDMASAISTLGCNIELALIETEGHKAIDVFYITRAGAKLDDEGIAELRASLLELAEI